ncbi:MAG: apolipoprotein N-acyltransferase, partial [Parachlamydiaceae bacterium]|nr:apolipoprotein N-acyltransferase [Parachlamydiaceae bacterium]
MKNTDLSISNMIYLFVSFLIVSFGQPVWSDWLGLMVALVGYALFFRGILFIQSTPKKFVISTLWFTAVQLVQFSWMSSHPFSYIYFVWLLLSLFMGLQWGCFSLFVKKSNLESFWTLLALSGLWTLFEWSRLYFFSGLPLNPAGLSLTGNLYPLQMASLVGIYGLTFWVIFTNLLFLRLWIFSFKGSYFIAPFIVCMIPYLFGGIHFFVHEKKLNASDTMNIVLVQPGFPVEESLKFQSAEEARQHVLNKWERIFILLKKQVGKSIDLIVLPEYVVPYGTFLLIYPEKEVNQIFEKIFGSENHVKTLFAEMVNTYQGKQFLLSNASIIQRLADLFQTDIFIGLEDTEMIGKRETYSSAFLFISGMENRPIRYEKRILVPMGEYIPFEWCQKLAANYGIAGSFQAGNEAKVFQGVVPIGCSICYEELFGHMMSDNRKQGAELLVNVTNDGWFPGST